MISVSIVERKLDNHLDPASDVSYFLCIFLAKSLVFLQSYSWPVKKMEQKINRSNECTEEGRRNTCNNSLCDLRAEAYTWETREVDPPQSSHSPGNNREKNRDHRGCIKCVDTWYDNSTQQLNRNRHHHALNHQVGTIDIVLLRLWIEARISHAPSSGFLIWNLFFYTTKTADQRRSSELYKLWKRCDIIRWVGTLFVPSKKMTKKYFNLARGLIYSNKVKALRLTESCFIAYRSD